MSSPIKWLSKKNVDPTRIADLLAPSIAQNQFTNGGPAVKKLESTFRTLFEIDDTKEVIVVNNGASALHALIGALQMESQKILKFATQSYTFPISAQGPLKDSLIVDIDSDGGLDLDQVCPSKVDGIIVTNILGHVVPIKKYIDWSTKYGKILLFDNAATSFTFYNGKNSLNYGLGSIVSFHHTKPIGFGEGGAIIVDRSLAHNVRCIINFGYDLVKLDQLWRPEGSNYKMSDVSAVYILHYLETFPRVRDTHRQLYSYFLNHLKEIQGVQIFPNFSDETPLVSAMPVIFPFPVNVDGFIALGIEAKKYYKPLILEGKSIELYSKIICFPCNVGMTIQDVDRILNAIRRTMS